MAPTKAASPPRERNPRSTTPLAPEEDAGSVQSEAKQVVNRHRPDLALAPEESAGAKVEAEAPLPLVVWVRSGYLHCAANYAEGTTFICGESMTDHPLIKPTPGYPAEWCPDCQKKAQGRELVAAR